MYTRPLFTLLAFSLPISVFSVPTYHARARSGALNSTAPSGTGTFTLEDKYIGEDFLTFVTAGLIDNKPAEMSSVGNGTSLPAPIQRMGMSSASLYIVEDSNIIPQTCELSESTKRNGERASHRQ